MKRREPELVGFCCQLDTRGKYWGKVSECLVFVNVTQTSATLEKRTSPELARSD